MAELTLRHKATGLLSPNGSVMRKKVCQICLPKSVSAMMPIAKRAEPAVARKLQLPSIEQGVPLFALSGNCRPHPVVEIFSSRHPERRTDNGGSGPTPADPGTSRIGGTITSYSREPSCTTRRPTRARVHPETAPGSVQNRPAPGAQTAQISNLPLKPASSQL
jgi:hypothetical protein